MSIRRAKIPKNKLKQKVRVKEYKKGEPSYTIKGKTTEIQQWRLFNNERGVKNINLQFPVKSIKQLGPGANLGPMGDLGDKVIFSIGLSQFGVDLLFSNIMPKNFNRTTIINGLRNIIYEPVFKLLDKEMELRTPRDTEDLMKALQKSLKAGWRDNNLNTITRTSPYKLSIGTIGIPYASVVNNMPESWIIHPGNHGKYGTTPAEKKRKTRSPKTGQILFDPLAKKQFFDYFIRIGRNLAEKQYEIFINTIIEPIFRQSQKNKLTGRTSSVFNNLKDLGISVRPNTGLASRQIFNARFR